MAYAAPSTKTTGDLITAAAWNQDIVANMLASLRVTDRQGGNVSNWGTAGDTNYDVIANTSFIQVGAKTWTGSADTVGTIVVTFPMAFSAVPVAIVSPMAITGGSWFSFVLDVAADTLTVIWVADAATTVISFTWLAIGPA